MTTKKHTKLKSYLRSNYIEFSDEQTSLRLNALYSDFSNIHSINPHAYDANVEFWKCIILDCNEQGHLGTIDYATAIDKVTLPTEFHRPLKGKPLALSCVFDHMEKEKSIMKIERFIEVYAPTAGWTEWVYNKISLWNYWAQSSAHQSLYVVVPTIAHIAKKIISDHFKISIRREIKNLLIYTEFRTKYAHHFLNELELTENDMDLVLRYLNSQYGIAVADNVKGYGTTYKVIKFPPKQEEMAIITKHDEAMINIRTTCHALSLQVDELQKKSEEFGKLSVNEYTQGHSARARYYLKRKKNLESVLEKRLKSMDTMDTVLIKIETSQDDIQVVQAFNAGAGTLQDILGKDELSIETIHEVMTKVSDSLDDQKEVEEAMKIGVEDNNFDQEIEQELAELVEKQTQPPVQEHVSEIPKLNSPEEKTIKPKEKMTIIPVDRTNSELARLNQIFTSVRNTPTMEKDKQEQMELA